MAAHQLPRNVTVLNCSPTVPSLREGCAGSLSDFLIGPFVAARTVSFSGKLTARPGTAGNAASRLSTSRVTAPDLGRLECGLGVCPASGPFIVFARLALRDTALST